MNLTEFLGLLFIHLDDFLAHVVTMHLGDYGIWNNKRKYFTKKVMLGQYTALGTFFRICCLIHHIDLFLIRHIDLFLLCITCFYLVFNAMEAFVPQAVKTLLAEYGIYVLADA